MPLIGEYGPSTSAWARKHAEMYEASWGLEGGDLQGKPVVVLTSIGAHTGMVRKTVVMRVAHAGATRSSHRSAVQTTTRSGITTWPRILLSSCRTARPNATTSHAS